jgi:hypothetical protein
MHLQTHSQSVAVPQQQPLVATKKLSSSHIAERKLSEGQRLFEGLEAHMHHHNNPSGIMQELRNSHGGASGAVFKGQGSASAKGPNGKATITEKKGSQKEQLHMRPRDKLLINNGGTVLGQHALIMPYSQQQQIIKQNGGASTEVNGKSGGSSGKRHLNFISKI